MCVRTCDRGSIGGRTSCLRLASRPGLGPLLAGEDVVLELDSVLLCWRAGDGRLEAGVTGLAAGMVSSTCVLKPFLALLVWASWHVEDARAQRRLFLLLLATIS
jgi:hypothetical protein